jgi:Iron-binding zinc finger CDGSH type/Divergent 4Fe-4S mono-cluster
MSEYATDEIASNGSRSSATTRATASVAAARVRRDARPWVTIDAARADEVEAAVALCPSGALRTRRRGGERREREQPLQVCASADGPLLVLGGVKIVGANGDVLFEGERAALCRCGGSSNKPFYDGTHRTNGFRG